DDGQELWPAGDRSEQRARRLHRYLWSRWPLADPAEYRQQYISLTARASLRFMPHITISYRRDDSGVITGRIFDRLVTHYGRDAVFRDIDSIPPGADFREHINHVL